jgi:hypothetical protein
MDFFCFEWTGKEITAGTSCYVCFGNLTKKYL